jgi:hypothetical protein
MSVVFPAPLGPTMATLLPMSIPMFTFLSPKSSRPGDGGVGLGAGGWVFWGFVGVCGVFERGP